MASNAICLILDFYWFEIQCLWPRFVSELSKIVTHWKSLFQKFHKTSSFLVKLANLVIHQISCQTDMSYKSYMFNAELVSASGLLIEIRTNGLPIVLWAFLRQLSTKQHHNEDEVGLRNNKGNRFDIISLQLIKFILGIAGWIRLRATVPNLQLEITQNMLQRGERSNYIMFHIICGV